MPVIYLDESGQFAKRADGDYFVVGSFTVGNPRRTEKQFRSWQREKFPRRLRHQPEVKFSEVKIDDRLRLKTLKFIADLDVRIRYSYLRRENIPFNYWEKDRLQSGHLYTNVIGETLEMYLPTDEMEFRAFCDERHLKGLRRADFKHVLTERLLPQMPKGAAIQIEMLDSTASVNIQIVDWITGALAWYLEQKPLGGDSFKILRNNILGDGKELFRASTTAGDATKQRPQSDD